MAKQKTIYKILFHNQGNIYELFAYNVSQGSMYAFIEISDIIFGERSKLVVDPGEEKLKIEFADVKRTYIPLHAVVRIDEVDKEGINKILAGGSENAGGGKITPFPFPPLQPQKT